MSAQVVAAAASGPPLGFSMPASTNRTSTSAVATSPLTPRRVSSPSKPPLPPTPNIWQLSAANSFFGVPSTFNQASLPHSPRPSATSPSKQLITTTTSGAQLPLTSRIPAPSTPKSNTAHAAVDGAPSSITTNPSSKGLTPKQLEFESSPGKEGELEDEPADTETRSGRRDGKPNTTATDSNKGAAATNGKASANPANQPKSGGKDGEKNDKDGEKNDGEDGHEKDEREQAERASQAASGASEMFKMDTASPQAAIRSIILMQNRISSLLLPAAADGHSYELRDIDHPCRVIHDREGVRLPLYSDMPALIWRVASLESLGDFDSLTERSTVLLPHWILPTRANNQCVAETMLLITEPDRIIPERDAATALQDNAVKEANRLRKDVVEWMDTAAVGFKDYKAIKSNKFLQLIDAFGFSTPVDAKTEQAFTTSFENMKKIISSEAPLHTADFAQVVAFMQLFYIEECRYRALSEPLAIRFPGDFDAAQGIVDSDSSRHVWRPDLLSKMRASKQEAVPHFGDTVYKRGAFVQYSRQPNVDAYVTHVIPMFPATNYLIASVNHPIFRLDPVRWVPLLPSNDCRFFSTVCHVLRDSPIIDEGELAPETQVHFARSGSLYTETIKEETKTYIVVHTWIKLGSSPFTHAKRHLEQMAAAPFAIMNKQSIAALKVLKEFETMELGAMDKLVPTAMVTLVRIGNLGKDISVDDLQAELEKLKAADATPIEMKRLAMDDLLSSNSKFEEINGPGDPTPAEVFVLTAPSIHSTNKEEAILRKLQLTDTGLWKELIFPDVVIDRAVEELIAAGLAVPALQEGEDVRVQTLFNKFLKSVADNADVFFNPVLLRHLRLVWTRESAFEGLLSRDALIEEANVEEEGKSEAVIDALFAEEEADKTAKEKEKDNAAGKKKKAFQSKVALPYAPPSSSAAAMDHKVALDNWLESLSNLLRTKTQRLAAWKTAFKGLGDDDSMWKPIREEHPVPSNNVSTAVGSWLPILARDDPQAYAIPAFHDGAIQLFLNDSSRAWASSKAMPLLQIKPKHSWFSNPSDRNPKLKGKSKNEAAASKKNGGGGGGGSAKIPEKNIEDLTREEEKELKETSTPDAKKTSKKKKKKQQADETANKIKAARKQHTPQKSPSTTTSNGSKRVLAATPASPSPSTAPTPSLAPETPRATKQSKSSHQRAPSSSSDDSPSKKQRRKGRAEETKKIFAKLLEPMIAEVKLLKSQFTPISSSSTPAAAPAAASSTPAAAPAAASSTPAAAPAAASSSTPAAAAASSTPVSSLLHEHARQFANGDPLKYMQFLGAMNAESDSKKKKKRKDKKRDRRDRSPSTSSNSSSNSSPRRRQSSSRPPVGSGGYMVNGNTYNPGIAAIAMGLNSTANSISQLQGYVSGGAGQLAPALPLSFPFHFMRN